jgi:hypothetical protein
MYNLYLIRRFETLTEQSWALVASGSEQEAISLLEKLLKDEAAMRGQPFSYLRLKDTIEKTEFMVDKEGIVLNQDILYSKLYKQIE